MTTKTLGLSALVLAGLLLAGCAGDEAAKTDQSSSASLSAPAPTLASLAADGPVALYFAKKDCGSNSRAVPLVQSVYQAYGGKARMLAVVNTPDAEYKGWSEQFGATMPNVDDTDLALTKKLCFAESQHLVLLDKDGNAEVIEGGFGREALMALNRALAKQAGVDPVEIDLSRAPNGDAYG